MAIVPFDPYTDDRRTRAKVVVDGVAKSFSARGRTVSALARVDLVLLENEFVCLVGPSGCGKTTLLNVIAGFEEPSMGTVRVGGQLINRPGPDRGVVFQQGALFTWMTVRDNVAFGLIAQGQTARKARSVADHFISMVGLGEFAERYPYELSGGMRQRVGIARAIAADPQILLMDEPFGALDQQTREVLQEEMKKIWRDTRKTIFWITHSLEEALYLGTHIMVMTARPGRIKAAFKVEYATADASLQESAELAADRRALFKLLREETVAAMKMEAAR